MHRTERGAKALRELLQTTVQDYPGRLKYWDVGIPPSGPMDNYSFRLANTANGLTVDARSDAAMEYAVFWCNHEVACLEPYTHLLIEPGRQAEWKIEYHFGTM